MSDLRVSELWRYPVKSVGGESLPVLELNERGPTGDRQWAVYDTDRKLGSGKNSRRFRRMDGLLDLSARLVDGIPVLVTGEGDRLGDDELARVLGHPGVRVEEESDIPHHDASPIHIVTTAGLRWLQDTLPETELSSRRFRPNIVIDAPGVRTVEQDWIGDELVVGNVRLRVLAPTERCRMVGASQPGLDDDNRVLKTLGAISDLQFGVYAEVLTVGLLAVGDTVVLE